VLRERVQECPAIAIRQHCRVSEIIGSSDGRTVTGVACRLGNGSAETIEADVVVDASGRGSLTMAYLAAQKFPVPEEVSIGADIAYGSAVFAMPDEALSDWNCVLTVATAPETSRGGLILPLEGGQWIVGLGGAHGEAAPGDWEGFLAYAETLRTRTISDAIRQAERLSEVRRFGFPESVWRRFDILEAFPRGLLPLGDAICRFNPIYGQGMSVAAQQAELLDAQLAALAREDDPLGKLAAAFFAAVPGIIEAPWSTAILDFVYPATRGQRPSDFESRLAFVEALRKLAAENLDVHRLMTEVQHLLKPPSVYRDPDLMARIQALMPR
jgi:2-polyprenyl-6-methoxyphenol hydroxylase-like FAD-dependent oxidoreductase